MFFLYAGFQAELGSRINKESKSFTADLAIGIHSSWRGIGTQNALGLFFVLAIDISNVVCLIMDYTLPTLNSVFKNGANSWWNIFCTLKKYGDISSVVPTALPYTAGANMCIGGAWGFFTFSTAAVDKVSHSINGWTPCSLLYLVTTARTSTSSIFKNAELVVPSKLCNALCPGCRLNE